MPRGKADGIFINTSGVGVVPAGVRLSTDRVEPGDVVLVSGPIGDHGVAILSRRAGIEFDGELASDTAPLHELVERVLATGADVHAMRDPTRGGVAATLVEIATRRQLGIDLDERRVPVRDTVRGACEILGLDPLLVANEGKLVVFVAEAGADAVLAALRAHPLGSGAAAIGRVGDAHRRHRRGAHAHRRRARHRSAVRRSAAADLLISRAAPAYASRRACPASP